MTENPQIIDVSNAGKVMSDLFTRLEDESASKVIIVPDTSDDGYGLITTQLIYRNNNNILFGNVISISAKDKPDSKKSIALFTLPEEPDTIKFNMYEGQLIEVGGGEYRFVPNED